MNQTKSPEIIHETFRISGMTSTTSVQSVENALLELAGVETASLNRSSRVLAVSYDPSQIDRSAIEAAVAAMGYTATHCAPFDEEYSAEVRDEELNIAFRRVRLAWILAVPVVLLMLVSMKAPIRHGVLIELMLAAPVLAIAGADTFKRGFRRLKAKAPSSDSLIAIGALAAYGSGFLAYAGVDVASLSSISALIISVHLSGHYLELRARSKTTAVMPSPRDLAPEDAPLRNGEDEVEIPAKDGDASEMLRARVAKLVREAQTSKPPIQDFADQMAAILVTVVLGVSLLTGVSWLMLPEMMTALGGWALPWLPWSPAAGTSDLSMAIYAVVAVLLVACPVAMRLATPSAIRVGAGVAAQRGLLVREGATFQRIKSLVILCIARSGSLTDGRPTVSEIEPVEGIERKSLLTWVAALCLPSEDAALRAILAQAIQERCEVVPISDIEEVPGRGMRARIDGELMLVGKPEFLKGEGVDLDRVAHVLYRMQREAKTVIAIAREGKAIGVFGLTDSIKVESVRAIKVLKRMGIQCVMITTDNRETAEVVAAQIGIGRVVANTMPQDRARSIAQLRKETIGTVGMVGDARSDVVALAAADVGFALGAGPDPAPNGGDVVLLKGDLNGLVCMIQLARATYATIVQNLCWAFAYNLIAVPLAMVGLIHPLLAIAFMSLSALSVLGNALRLRNFDPEKVTKEVMRR